MRATARRTATKLAMALVAIAGAARAQWPAGPPTRLVVRVGHTATLDVGYARGLFCDDVTIVRAELRGESATNNRLYLAGVRPGTTLCRVGTDRYSPSVLVRVVVEP